MNSDRECEQLFSGGNWFLIPRRFLFILPLQEAVILAHLINLSGMVRAAERYGGWFYCVAESVGKHLNVGVQPFRRAAKSLESKGFVETKRQGMPAKKYYRILYANIQDALLDIELPAIGNEWDDAEDEQGIGYE